MLKHILGAILLAAWAAMPAFADDITIYRWVDAEGVLHLSDEPPATPADVSTVSYAATNPENFDAAEHEDSRSKKRDELAKDRADARAKALALRTELAARERADELAERQRLATPVTTIEISRNEPLYPQVYVPYGQRYPHRRHYPRHRPVVQQAPTIPGPAYCPPHHACRQNMVMSPNVIRRGNVFLPARQPVQTQRPVYRRTRN